MKDFDLTPSPALLDLLGKIPFKGWQCVAELVDNSIDAIIKNHASLRPDQRVIRVTVPRPSSILSNEPLVVEDWGCGMTEDQLEQAVRAGFSSKDTKSSLGLFGMGFNVATSRLANSVTVWTSTPEMSQEIGVSIDLRDMKRSGSYFRPQLSRDKSEEKKSGTRVEVFDFKPDAKNLLKSSDILKEIRRAYTEEVFERYGVRIEVNDKEVSPFRFCVWDKNRSVKHKYEDIPAVLDIDESLGEEAYCENCYSWLGPVAETSLKRECPYCQTVGSQIVKEIRIAGWIGIQRYSDTEHFGIDISRNGRILSRLDKSLFHWNDERVKDDPRFHPEYPRDTTYAGGRIVGQIEANFVMPEYTKDDFARDDPNWKRAVNFLRGDMPLQPELASSLNFKQANRSAIGRLFNAYRRVNVPGSKTLIFARENGSVDHTTPKQWASRFYEGEADYQDDSKWWSAVTRADLRDSPGGFDPLNPKPKPATTGTGAQPTEGGSTTASTKYPGKSIHKKSLRFDLEKLLNEKPIEVTLLEYYPDVDVPQPILFEPQGMNRYLVYLNTAHPMFRDFQDGYDDLIYLEVASKFANIKNSPDWPLTRVYYELKAKHSPESMLSVPGLVSRANNLMREIQNRLVRGDGFPLPRALHLNEHDERALKKKFLDQEKKNLSDVKGATVNTGFLRYMELNYLFRFVKEFPELVFDGKVFNMPYEEIDDVQMRHESLEKYASYFHDVRWFMNELQQAGDDEVRKSKQLILRNRLSLDILHGSMVR